MEDAMVPLRDYVDARLLGMEKVGELAMRNGETYIAQFHQLRDEVNATRGLFVSKETFDMGVTDVMRRLEAMDERLTRMEERQRTTARNLTWAVTIIGLAFTVVNFVRGNPF